jgi:hypothetical protein
MNPKLPPEPTPKHTKPVPFAAIESRIYLIGETKVMLYADLAGLYGVATKNLNKAVERNRERFPEDFMFQLSLREFADLRFQFGTSNRRTPCPAAKAAEHPLKSKREFTWHAATRSFWTATWPSFTECPPRP